jgi:CBS-domain-containing membrane protein
MNLNITRAGSDIPKYDNLGRTEKLIDEVIENFDKLTDFLQDDIKKYIRELKKKNYAVVHSSNM